MSGTNLSGTNLSSQRLAFGER
ncbi:hypothetical protein LF941_14035, partial [Pectobacterium versatile]|nr:hypothetical protein [Pectobacterium versatile]